MKGNEQFTENGVLKYNPNRHGLVITGERRPTISIATQALPYELQMSIPQMVAHCLTAVCSSEIRQLQIPTTRISSIGDGREINGDALFTMTPENVDVILEQLVFSDVWRVLSGQVDEPVFHGLSDGFASKAGGFLGISHLKKKIRLLSMQEKEGEIEKIRDVIRRSIEKRANVSDFVGLQRFAAECFWATQGEQFYDAYTYAFNAMVQNALYTEAKMRNYVSFGLNVNGTILHIRHYLDSRELPIEVPIFYDEYNRKIHQFHIETDGFVGVQGGPYGKNTISTVEVTQGFTPYEIAVNPGVLVVGLPRFKGHEADQRWDPMRTYGNDTWEANGLQKILKIAGTGNSHTIVRVVINDEEFKVGTKTTYTPGGTRRIGTYPDKRRPTLVVRPHMRSGYRDGQLQIAGFKGESDIGHNRGDVILVDSGEVTCGEIDGNVKVHNTSGHAMQVHGSFAASGNGYFNKEYTG